MGAQKNLQATRVNGIPKYTLGSALINPVGSYLFQVSNEDNRMKSKDFVQASLFLTLKMYFGKYSRSTIKLMNLVQTVLVSEHID